MLYLNHELRVFNSNNTSIDTNDDIEKLPSISGLARSTSTHISETNIAYYSRTDSDDIVHIEPFKIEPAWESS